MELEGAKCCFQFLTLSSLSIPVFVFDRHRGIAKWIQSVHPNTAHLHGGQLSHMVYMTHTVG